jgi:hypothetical protein
MVNIPMCYNNSTIVNIYWHCRKLVYKYIYIHPTTGYKITYSVATLSYDNCYANLRDYNNSLLCDLL